jgi:hypothetical protein
MNKSIFNYKEFMKPIIISTMLFLTSCSVWPFKPEQIEVTMPKQVLEKKKEVSMLIEVKNSANNPR